MSMSDKIFKISVLTLLVLILGVLVGIFFSVYFPGDDYELSLLEEEFDDLGFVEPDDSYSYDEYSYDEFSRFVGSDVRNIDGLFSYATSQGFEFYQDFEFYVFESPEICGFDAIRQREICYFEIYEAIPGEDMVVVVRESLE